MVISKTLSTLFPILAEASIALVTPVRPPVSCISAAPTERIFEKFDTEHFS
jgi:hypothetical protein